MIEHKQTASRLLVFTGDGKGKTTAALGMALRALGHGHRVLFLQFMKGDDSTGEIAAVGGLLGIEFVQTGLGFVPRPDHPNYPKHRAAAEAALARAERALREGAADLVVLDEICTAVSMGLLEAQTVLAVVEKASPGTHLVLTGRGAPAAFLERADTVTDMHCVKHALSSGRHADEGVEW